MKNGLVITGSKAVRKDPSHAAEMCSELLFGESFQVRQVIGNWLEIIAGPDCGWIENNSLVFQENTSESASAGSFLLQSTITLTNDRDEKIHLSPGSELPGYSAGQDSFRLGPHTFTLTEPLKAIPETGPRERLGALAKQFLGAPFLQGGRSVFGMDARGLVRVLYKLAGQELPGDIASMARAGELVSFREDARAGPGLF